MRFVISVAMVMVFLSSCSHKPSFPELQFKDRMIAIDTGALSNGVPVFYSAVVGGKKADFFVLLLDGEVRAYFDACKECYFKKLGYRFDKGHVVCKACNIRFPLDRLDSGIGGCYPIKLKGTMKGNVFTISREDIAAGLKYF